jgi:hypothetical protein
VADDLGPLGRLVAPGELLVLSPGEEDLVRRELEWVGSKYHEAKEKADRARVRLKTAHLGMRREHVRDMFEIWTWEAAKLVYVGHCLKRILGLLQRGEEAVLDLPRRFRISDMPQVESVRKKMLAATDAEIVDGARF